jgi:hypothetical protein
VNEQYPAGPITVKGADFDTWVDGDGTWYAEVNGTTVQGTTKADLAKALSQAIRVTAITVAVPFLVQTRNPDHRTVGVRSGVATGIHASTRAILATWDDTGEKTQLSRMGSEKYLNPATADPAEWTRLTEEYLAASRAVYRYEETHKFGLTEAVQVAMRVALTSGGSK